MADQRWALPQLRKILPLEDSELLEMLTYTNTLPESEAARHLHGVLGDSPDALAFVVAYTEHRSQAPQSSANNSKAAEAAAEAAANTDPATSSGAADIGADSNGLAPPPPPGYSASGYASPDANGPPMPTSAADAKVPPPSNPDPPAYMSSQGYGPSQGQASSDSHQHYANKVARAGARRARDEQLMQNKLQELQYRYRIYNSDIEPEHDTEYYCGCPIHQYKQMKWNRLDVQQQWAQAVMYPGEKFYSDVPTNIGLFNNNNPYKMRVISPYGNGLMGGTGFGQSNWSYNSFRPIPRYHAQWLQSTIQLNNALNLKAQNKINALEPKFNIWDEDELAARMEKDLKLDDKKGPSRSEQQSPAPTDAKEKRKSKLSERFSSKVANLKKAAGIKSPEEIALEFAGDLRSSIRSEEAGRWPDGQWRQIVYNYQVKVGMAGMIANLRARSPLQYLHLLRAGYFEPIPVAWADQASNPLKFTVDAEGGWRGITPNWRGYEDLAEERLYWVLNHREGSVGMRMKPDFISEMNMANERMARAVEPPPLYFSNTDTCRVEHTSSGNYSKQVMSQFQPYDRPEKPTDDTMILLDVSGSMDFDPIRPVYMQYLVTSFERSTQPKNKAVAKAIVRRFADAMANHDHDHQGYDLVTFANHSEYIGRVHHRNFEQMWRKVRIGGGTRVMTGWQQVKNLHFQKHAQSATYHPVYGWQAGPGTPMLRLLLLLDGEAQDMDEFELDLLGLDWAHVTIFLIGVDGCPHHHRHANELQRISDVNHHVSFVDAQGNFPERFVTHELLKRHLGYDVTMQEFEQMEELPPYTE